MPPAVKARVNMIGNYEQSILTFTNRHGQEIGDITQDLDHGVDDEKEMLDKIIGVGINLDDAASELTGVDSELTGVDTDLDAKPTGVEVETSNYGNSYDAVP